MPQAKKTKKKPRKLTVAVTGPTGTFGFGLVPLQPADDRIGRIVGIARRPFDPAEHGWTKTQYRQGDVLDREAVDALVADADVVVHLAYVILGSRAESRRVNLAGTRNVLAATVAAARPRRLVYTSSVAAYGYYPDNPVPLTEDVPPRGSPEHYYSAQKAECEALVHEATRASDLEVYLLRPSIVAGPDATILLRSLPWRQVADRLPARVRALLGAVPGLRPVIPDPGVPIQLVHHDDVASAVVAAVHGKGSPGAYNVAADGVVSISEFARAVGAYAVPVPWSLARAASQTVARVPFLPSQAEWLHAARARMEMDTAKARRELVWRPRHDAHETLTAMVAADRGLSGSVGT